MGQLLCAQQHPARQARSTSNQVAGDGAASAAGTRNEDLFFSSADSSGGASALQCGPRGSLSETDAAALFGHYSDAEAHAPTESGRDESSEGRFHLSPTQVREGARTIRAALGTVSSDQDAIVRILNQHPEMVRAVREAYDAEFSVTGKGLVADLRKYLAEPGAELTSALLTRAGISGGQKSPIYIKPTAKGQIRSHHAIVASPAIKVAVPGTEIRYTVAKDAEIYSEGSYYTYQWLCLNDPQTSKSRGMPEIISGPMNAPSWSARWEFPGNHKILCRVQLRFKESGFFGGYTDRAPEYIEYQQTVHEQGDVLARAIDKLPRRESPDAQLRLLHAYRQALRIAEAQPGSEKLDAKTQEALDAQLAKLGDRLKSSEGHTRYPLRAVHVAAESAQVSPLNVFVSKIAEKGGHETWLLVDITNPTDRRLTGEYIGTGKDARQALRSAIAAWDSRNRYPKGRLRLQVPAETGASLDQEFQTDGMSFWDSIAEFFNQVGFCAGIGMLGAAIVATVAPDPTVSKVAAVLLWTSILAGTAGASLSMIQRHAEGLSTVTEDAFDTITIVGNVLGAGWTLGATVKGLSLAGSRMGTAIAIGRFGTDAAQGILLSVEYVKEYQQILADPDPKSRTDKLMQLLGKAALSGGLLILSMRGNKADLEQLGAQKASLGKLGQRGETIDLSKAPTERSPSSKAAEDQNAAQQPHPVAHVEPQQSPEPAPVTTPHTSTQSQHDVQGHAAIATDAQPTSVASKSRAWVTDPVPGHFDSVDARLNQAPLGWKFHDTVEHLSDGKVLLITECWDSKGKKGNLRRLYDPKSKSFTMNEAFFDDEMERWIKAGTPMIEGEGTPAVSYLMLRQLKMAGVGFGGLKTVKISTVQNVKSAMQLAKLQREAVSLGEAVRRTHSVDYAETTLVQSGHRIVGMDVDITGAWRTPIDDLLMHYETHRGRPIPRDPAIVKKHDEMLAKFGLKRTDEVLWNYDIYLELAPYTATIP